MVLIRISHIPAGRSISIFHGLRKVIAGKSFQETFQEPYMKSCIPA